MGSESDAKRVTCCLCHEQVTASGYCEMCQRWPINVTPHRYDEQGHRVEVDGFCKTCLDYVATRLEHGNAEWVDTGIVPKLLTREENKRRWHELRATMERNEIRGLRSGRDLETQKRILRDLGAVTQRGGIPVGPAPDTAGRPGTPRPPESDAVPF